MNWETLIALEKNKPYFQSLMKKLDQSSATIYPSKEDWFKAFMLTPFSQTKVVLIGQDPYINEKQAHGLSFSVLEGKIPPSLLNIKKELEIEFGFPVNMQTNLTCWAKQGVLLLNRVLTVEAKNANSHRNIGWEKFTQAMIQALNEHRENVVFILLGNQAFEVAKWIDPQKHCVIKAPHPSPLSAYRGFFNSQIFINTNLYLRKHNLKEINWEII